MKKTMIIFFMTFFSVICLWGLTAEEIMNKVDKNETFKTSKATGSMIITDRFGKRKSEYISYSKGLDNTLIVFTSVEEEGQKVLRVDEKMYLFFPDAEEVILLQGSALKEGLLGSDISYEDMAGDKNTLKNYSAELKGSENIDSADCYIVHLNARPKKQVAYDSYTIWVDKKNFGIRKAEYFSRSGKKIKEMMAMDFKVVADKTVATKIIMKDLLKKNSSTEMQIDDIKVNITLPANTFSLEELNF